MITKDIKKLFQRLNGYNTRMLETAAGFCITRGHYQVSLEHILLKLLEDGTGDIPQILNHYEVQTEKLWNALLVSLESYKTGNTGRPTFSPILMQVIESAWIVASVHHSYPEIRSGHILEAMLDSDELKNEGYMSVLEKVKSEDLRQNFINIVANSAEDKPASLDGPRGTLEMPQREGETALDIYTNNITQKARDGRIDPIFGRDKEIRQAIDILSRRRKNNPILVGEPGVGKSAIIEGLALRIVQGDVPDNIKDCDIRELDLGSLQAGAGVKGEFENRLKAVIKETKESAKPIILFIDEAHTLIGAGGSAGTGDAANLLKPALARGELRTVAATTWSEYKKYIEKDPALERRFQLIKVDEPDLETAAIMMRGIKGIYEKHHGLQITNEAAFAAAELSKRYIAGRQLPDKAVDLLDTASARVRMGQSTMPGVLDDVVRQLQNIEIDIKATERDIATGMHNNTELLASLKKLQEETEQERQRLEAQWQAEDALVKKVVDIRAKITNKEGDDKALREELDKIHAELSEIQGEVPLVHAEVNPDVVAQVIADWTGIPAGNMMKDEAHTLLELDKKLKDHIKGQDEAIEDIADMIRTAKAGMRNPDAPIAVFLFVGPSGVGKTESARMIAEELFGGEHFLTTINMSEYQESHTVSQLKGSPPGYVGYGEGGILTEAVRQKPYSVVLLDEVEKAHRDVLNLFYQVFDKGFMRDGEGREIDFKNTIIMLTSNLGTDKFMEICSDGARPSPDEIRDAIHYDLVNHFQAALLGRMKTIPYYPLSKDAMALIAKLKLNKIGKRLAKVHDMDFSYSLEVLDLIVDRCTNIDAGARNIDFIIDKTVLPEASRALLMRMAADEMPKSLRLDVDDDGFFVYEFDGVAIEVPKKEVKKTPPAKPKVKAETEPKVEEPKGEDETSKTENEPTDAE